MGAITLNGAVAGTRSTFPTVQGEYDVSIQLIPALSGAGDSLWFSYIVYQSNSDADAVWTALAAADTVSTTTDSDAIYEITDALGLRYSVICTGISADMCTVTPYFVVKKHANE